MPSCVVKCCKNNSTVQKKCQGITFHRFPKDAYRKDDWVHIIRGCRGEDDWNPSLSSTVCSAHFDDSDFKTTFKGLRYLNKFAIPKKLLLKPPRFWTNKLPKLQPAPVHKETPTLTAYCRLCATLASKDRLVDIQKDTDLKQLVVNMSTRLNTNIDFTQEHLPSTICSVCIKALYTAYDFVVGIDLAQVTLHNLSAQKFNDENAEILSPVNCVDLPCIIQQGTIKTELMDEEQPPAAVDTSSSLVVPKLSPKMEPDCDMEPVQPGIEVPSLTAPVPLPQPPAEISDYTPTYECIAPSILESRLHSIHSISTIPIAFDPLRHQYRDIEVIDKKQKTVHNQKRKIKTLNQKIKRLQIRNLSLKNKLKSLDEHVNLDAKSDN